MHFPKHVSEVASSLAKSNFVQYFVHLLIIFLCVGSQPPSVNESHYLPKARHAWDSSYASGGDIFLESHDSHFLATTVAGLAAQVWPLATVAWLGRLVSWCCYAVAWVKLTQSLGLAAVLRPLALITWFLATQYGHWAGEWALGGFEAKTLAYPCILMALAALVRGRWAGVWIWLGLAVAWHPVVGGWAGLTVGIVWLMQSNLRQRFMTQLPWLALATLIGLIGLVPALAGIGGVDQIDGIVPAQVHVYYRIAHHMCPRTFALPRNVAAIVSLLVFSSATFAWFRLRPQEQRSQGSLLIGLAWLAVGFCLVGLAIDIGLTPVRPDIAAKLLRFYWFRWADISVPLAWTLTLWLLVQQYAFHWQNDHQAITPAGNYVVGGLLLVSSILLGMHINLNWQRTIPAADDLLVESPGRYEVHSDRYRDWLAVCEWIRSNTPSDSLWFTPKYQQTFKWYTGRAEVVCWKDVPQDNASVIEWYQRIQRCAPPRDSQGVIREWTTQELLALSAEYGFQWVLLDRTYQATPPALEFMYPIDIENRSFAICRIPAGMVVGKRH